MPEISSEAIFVLIFLLISFISWIKDQLSKGRNRPGQLEAQQQQRPEPRYDAEPPDFPAAPRQRSQTPQPNDAMRDILKSLGIPVEEEVVSKPPPLPQQQIETFARPASPIAATESTRKKAIVVAPEAFLSKKERAALKRKEAYGISEHHAGHPVRVARNLLKPKHVQAAFVLKEILDKPKCFEY
jgi:hypothetical protein